MSRSRRNSPVDGDPVTVGDAFGDRPVHPRPSRSSCMAAARCFITRVQKRLANPVDPDSSPTARRSRGRRVFGVEAPTVARHGPP